VAADHKNNAHDLIPKPSPKIRSKLRKGISRTLEIGHSSRKQNDIQLKFIMLTALPVVLILLFLFL
jgi:hypothetical protein